MIRALAIASALVANASLAAPIVSHDLATLAVGGKRVASAQIVKGELRAFTDRGWLRRR